MKKPLLSWSSLAVLTPLLGACAMHADVAPPAVSANVDVNGQAAATVPATAATVDTSATVVGAGAPQETYDDTDPSALTDFHQTLDSHGTWVDDPTYGTVWVPASSEVGGAFAPYTTAGHWAYDDNDDYVWVSDYDWGWAPFHYGRWAQIEGRGWGWIPGRVYRGAWVNWGADDGYGYVGWAPMGPEYVWRGGVAVGYTYTGTPRWNYVGRGDVFSANVGTRVLTGSAAAGISGRVHATASVGGHSGGPPPEKLGISAGQAPHVGGSGAAGIAKAKQFGQPTTAAQLGGHAPSHVAASANVGVVGHEGAPGAAGHETTTGHLTTTATTHAAMGARGGASPSTTPATGGVNGHASTTHLTDQTTNAAHVNPQAGQPAGGKPKPQPQPQQTPKTGGAPGGGGGGGHKPPGGGGGAGGGKKPK
jgi:hypothetical protein